MRDAGDSVAAGRVADEGFLQLIARCVHARVTPPPHEMRSGRGDAGRRRLRSRPGGWLAGQSCGASTHQVSLPPHGLRERLGSRRRRLRSAARRLAGEGFAPPRLPRGASLYNVSQPPHGLRTRLGSRRRRLRSAARRLAAKALPPGSRVVRLMFVTLPPHGMRKRFLRTGCVRGVVPDAGNFGLRPGVGLEA